MPCTDPCDCPINKFDAVTAPTVNDDNCDTSGNGVFCPGSMWWDTVAGKWYFNVDATCTAADWQEVMGRDQLTQFSVTSSAPQSGIVTSTHTVLEADNVLYNLYTSDVYRTSPNWDFQVTDAGIYLVEGSFVAPSVTKSAATPENGRLCTMSLWSGVGGSTFRGNLGSVSPVFIRDGESITISANGVVMLSLNSGDYLTVKMFHTFGDDLTLDDTSGGFIRNSWKVSRLTEYYPL